MKTFVFTALLLISYVAGVAQTRDSVAAKPKPNVVFNPNSRRNGYENYQDAAVASGVGLNPGATINTIDHRYAGLRGTPYFIPEWSKGQIEMVKGQSYTEVSLKFDAFRQHLLLLRTWVGHDSIIINADQVKSFQLRSTSGQSYLFKHFPDLKTNDETLKEGYFIVLYDGLTALLKRVVKRFKPADYKNPYGNNIYYDAFTESDTYYVLKPDQTLTKVKLSKKSLLDALSGREENLKAFANQEQLTFGNEADAITLVKHYNNL